MIQIYDFYGPAYVACAPYRNRAIRLTQAGGRGHARVDCRRPLPTVPAAPDNLRREMRSQLERRRREASVGALFVVSR